MNKEAKENEQAAADFIDKVGASSSRKIKAQRNPAPGIWFGMGMMGLVGWSVVVPTLIGAALGIWLDKHYMTSYSWSLALIVAGLCVGCFNAWYWVDKEHRAMREDQDNDND